MDQNKELNQQPTVKTPPLAPLPVKHTSKFPLIIGIILLVTLVGSGAYYVGTKSSKLTISSNNSQYDGKTISPTQSTLPSPTIVTSPKSEPIGEMLRYTNPSLAISFQYPTPYRVSENINDQTALKADSELWVALPGSDQIILELYAYKSNLPAESWWNTEGIKKIQQLQNDFYSAIQPKPSPFPFPRFTTRTGVLAGKPTLIAEGTIQSAQREGVQTITIIQINEKIYMFIEQADNKSLGDKILNSLQFVKQ